MTDATVAAPLAEDVVTTTVAEHPKRTGDLLGILETLQKRHPNKYLPRETLRMVAAKTGLASSRVLSVATFYSFFNLEPQGRNIVMVCRGTACHTRGAKQLHDALVKDPDLALEPHGDDYRTATNSLTIRNVSCFGQCALAPVVAVNDEIYSDITPAKMKAAVQEAIGEDDAS